ncbi:MAG TPA: Rho termination factor N-terminal domain-containing protein [Salinimicrobium sp.]|nr:Rho termination factor N-terminal domain-containing protein [Salinimicrobium sp.]
MRGKLKKEGKFDLFETTHGHQILNLENEEFYALVKGQQGDIIVHSDSDHKKDKTISKGKFFYADFDDDPAFKDMDHLFMEDGNNFREILLPEGLPTKNDTQKKLIRPKEKLSKSKVQDHLKGKGNKGDEKQYSGKEEGLRKKTKEELYDMAQKQKIRGRSKMKKEELIDELQEKKSQ